MSHVQRAPRQAWQHARSLASSLRRRKRRRLGRSRTSRAVHPIAPGKASLQRSHAAAAAQQSLGPQQATSRHRAAETPPVDMRDIVTHSTAQQETQRVSTGMPAFGQPCSTGCWQQQGLHTEQGNGLGASADGWQQRSVHAAVVDAADVVTGGASVVQRDIAPGGVLDTAPDALAGISGQSEQAAQPEPWTGRQSGVGVPIRLSLRRPASASAVIRQASVVQPAAAGAKPASADAARVSHIFAPSQSASHGDDAGRSAREQPSAHVHSGVLDASSGNSSNVPTQRGAVQAQQQRGEADGAPRFQGMRQRSLTPAPPRLPPLQPDFAAAEPGLPALAHASPAVPAAPRQLHADCTEQLPATPAPPVVQEAPRPAAAQHRHRAPALEAQHAPAWPGVPSGTPVLPAVESPPWPPPPPPPLPWPASVNAQQSAGPPGNPGSPGRRNPFLEPAREPAPAAEASAAAPQVMHFTGNLSAADVGASERGVDSGGQLGGALGSSAVQVGHGRQVHATQVCTSRGESPVGSKRGRL